MKTNKAWATFILYTLSVFAFVSHIFCCALPLLLISINFFAVGGAYAHHWLHHPIYEWIHQYHIWIISIAIISTSISTFLILRQKQKNRKIKILVITSIALLIMDVSILFAEEHFFHINH